MLIASHDPAPDEDGRHVRQTPTDAHQPLTLSVEEAGRLLGISRGLAYMLVQKREIPSVQLGRRIVVPRRALEQLLDGPDDAA